MRLLPILLAGCALLASAAEGDPSFARSARPLLMRHCGDCHSDEVTKGGIDLGRYATPADVLAGMGQLDAALRAVREERMPPKGKGRLGPEDRAALVAALTRSLEHAVATAPPDPGRVVLHRLSRGEYNRTVRDLLGVDSRPADAFPADGGGGAGFSNAADTLFASPLLIEKLLDAAEQVLEQAKPDRVFTVKPADDSPKARREAAKQIVAGFARRAFRRPVPAAEVERLLRPFDQAMKKNFGFEPAVRHMLKAVLVSPHFVYRVEVPRPGAEPYPLSHDEIAVRLSYFLWSSMPDDELFRLAEQKKLHDDAVIEAQVRRMLQDPKAAALGEEFAPQWLQLDQFAQGNGPDPQRYRELTPELRAAMLAEPVAFFNALVRHDRSLVELVASDWTWVNGPLAAVYGIRGVSGPELREVRHGDPARGGVLGMAAVLAATSHPGRTSPVLRGRWVLDRLLDAAPPPPPPDIPQLPKEETPQDDLTVRARLEAHRARVECAGCHAVMDPIGFGLENFDPLGRWRDRDLRGRPIDNAGTLPDGRTFGGPKELRALLLERKREIARTIAANLLAYALGRGIEWYDRPAIERIAAAAEADDWKMSRVLVAVALSYPFRHARERPPVARPAAVPAPTPEKKP